MVCKSVALSFSGQGEAPGFHHQRSPGLLNGRRHFDPVPNAPQLNSVRRALTQKALFV